MKTDLGKRKIIKDRKLPNSEQISKHQNFDNIQSNYSVVQKLMLKKGIIWTGAAACVAGAAAVVYLNTAKVNEKELIATNETPKKIDACVQPPIPGKEMPYATYRISAKNGGILNYPTGSSITIPANAFHKSNGAPVSDSIDIKYREFHSPLEIFLSGIPMEYDSAGVERTLESAGMIEILASDNGEKLELNEENPIDVKMATTSEDPKFNLYELDTINKNWVYKGKDKIEEPSQTKTASHKETTRQMAPQTDNTIKPAMADAHKFNFKINFDKSEHSELAAYNNVLFEVTDNNFKPAFYKVNWKSISLHSGETTGTYIVKLSKADTTISVAARPVFDKVNYESAMQQFEANLHAANKAREAKNAEMETAVIKVNRELANYHSKDLIKAAIDMTGLSLSIRNFQVRSLGYHNIDFPVPAYFTYAYKLMRNAAEQDAIKKISDKTYSDIFLVEKGKNTVFRFTRGEPVRCNPEAKNLMWTVTRNNEIAFFRVTDFMKLKNSGENNIDPVIATDQNMAFAEIRKFSL